MRVHFTWTASAEVDAEDHLHINEDELKCARHDAYLQIQESDGELDTVDDVEENGEYDFNR